MKAKWLLETDVFSENLKRLVEEVNRQGMDVRIASYVPYEDEKGYLGLFEKDDCVFYYGSLNFAAQVSREAPWIPGVMYNRPAYQCTNYYPALYPFLLNQNHVMLPYGELVHRKDWLFEHVGKQDTLFVRPNTGSKLFTGTQLYRERYEKDVGYLDSYGAQPHDLCVVCEPVNILDEWRFIAVDTEIITGSQYRNNDKTDVQPGYPQEALDLAKKVVAAGYNPDRAWCIDICRTKADELWLLEIGAISCAGWYACDMEKVVREVSRVAVEEWREYRE